MDYPSSVIMAPEGYAEYFKHMALTVKLLIFVNGVWNEIQTSTLHYSPVNITSADNRVEADFQVYPNPFRETIRFKGSDEMMQFTLADLQGRIVLRSKVTGTSEISTLGIPSGMYIYQVEGMNFKYAGKLVKE
jgi:hypothetical protein